MRSTTDMTLRKYLESGSIETAIFVSKDPVCGDTLNGYYALVSGRRPSLTDQLLLVQPCDMIIRDGKRVFSTINQKEDKENYKVAEVYLSQHLDDRVISNGSTIIERINQSDQESL